MLGSSCSPCCGQSCSAAAITQALPAISIQWQTSGLGAGRWAHADNVTSSFYSPFGDLISSASTTGGYLVDGGSTHVLTPGVSYVEGWPNQQALYAPPGQTVQDFSRLNGDLIQNKIMAWFYCGTETSWTTPGNFLWLSVSADVVAAQAATLVSNNRPLKRGASSYQETVGTNFGFSSASPYFNQPSLPSGVSWHFNSVNGVLRSWITWTGDRPSTLSYPGGGTVTIDKYILATDSPLMWEFRNIDTYSFLNPDNRVQKVVARFVLPPALVGQISGSGVSIYSGTQLSSIDHDQVGVPRTGWGDRINSTGWGLAKPGGWSGGSVPGGRLEAIQEYVDRYPTNSLSSFTYSGVQSALYGVFAHPASSFNSSDYGEHPGTDLGVGQFGTRRRGPSFTATIGVP